ncbi:chromatin-remodeling ATPase INO80 [Nematocida homosporus]|uniref:chromatin-remodeling ATPase INO80 n=1 Tax=Nematocida homosporus TaxID=1912981 RepID=UPI002220CAC9|nr:chromatin-remodeling ATPase INO80 [Nematocida homosporus]KAI5186166.1 chromatin-remodeling ATPase INO80 [Nematocida homosporus]
MGVPESDSTSDLVQYQIELHRKLKMAKMIRAEKKIKGLYQSAQRTLYALGLDLNRLPPPSMDPYIERSHKEEILQEIKNIDQSEHQVSVEEETKRVYEEICKKSIPKVHKALISLILTRQAQHRKISTVCQRELKRALAKTSKTNPVLKGKRITKELQQFFKRCERTIREKRRKEEKEDYERRKKEEEEEEEARQAKKLDFLITQTELFSHFILGKRPAGDAPPTDLSTDPATDEQTRLTLEAAEKHKRAVAEFGTTPIPKGTKPGVAIDSGGGIDGGSGSAGSREGEGVNEGGSGGGEAPVYNNSILPISQGVAIPSILRCTLKDYQKRGLEWLISLYDQGINGMLADEMGLGKTVQAISFLAYLAEKGGNWGPFLVVTPASTLHNWEQEFTKFVPTFKVVSYWGTVADRKAQRKSWQQRKLHKEESPFHVVITSYQLAVTDEKYFSKIKWQYMVLDEAQAIKSSSSARWKTLLSFKARSRLLLTGTPIQNTLHELWALLHFIMPTLFDSHGEFSEWFKIEDGDSVTEAARLRMVLQPFMLRREKKDVADELGQKIEKTIICELSPKQKRLYEGIQMRAPMASFLDNALPDDLEGMEGLMNLVMQFRKVCNHPDLFEKKETSTGWCQPPNQIYIPQVLAPLAFYPVARVPGQFLLETHPAYDRKRFWCSTPDVKRMKLEPSLSEDLVGALETACMPRCIPPKQVAISPAYVPTAADLPVDLRAELPTPPVYVPSMGRFVSDSGKLCVLDTLLPKLKEEGHRVLMYFQMTKMIDLFEEYLMVRNYSYLRLDGSSKIANRKELVKDWQSNADRFIFLLSTRAGGLGINLTAADTVIFYDSDWNPTADQQAMDRAHRLGQTKQVTVYRLITAGTIEERIMERAGVKGEIQRMVIKTRD